MEAFCVTITRRVGGDGDGDRDRVCGVRVYGLGGQDGDHVPANEIWGEVPFTVTAADQVYKQMVELAYLGRSNQRKSRSQCRGNASNPESMNMLRAV